MAAGKRIDYDSMGRAKTAGSILFICTSRWNIKKEYEAGWKITDIMPVNSVGIVTARDNLAIHESLKQL